MAVAAVAIKAPARSEPPRGPVLPSTPAQKPIYEQATAEAWTAFRSGNNETAIAKADECISRFRAAADRIQSILETNKPDLPIGKVSETDKERIARYQIVHDVATCLLIKGWAEERLGHIAAARKAYAETEKYTCARASDSNGNSFWSPAEAASKRLAKLSGSSSQ